MRTARGAGEQVECAVALAFDYRKHAGDLTIRGFDWIAAGQRMLSKVVETEAFRLTLVVFNNMFS